MENQIILINLVPNMSTPAVVRVSQYDVGRPLVFKVYDGTSPAVLTGVTAVIEGTKKSGLGFSESGTVADNTVMLNTTLAMTQEDGMIPAEIRFSKTGEDVGTANFILAVEPSPHLEGTTDGTTETMADLQSQLDALDGRVEVLEAGGGGGGLTEAVKSAMLQIAQKVAYIDEHGQDYYDALESALYPSEYPLITAVFNAGSNVIYTDDTLNSLKQYLTVKYFETEESTGTVVPSANYTLSGALIEGTSTVYVAYNDLRTSFVINNVVNFYNIMERSVSDGLMSLRKGGVGQTSGGDARIVDYSQNYPRYSTYVTRGKRGMLANDSTTITNYYPVPIPSGATTAKIDITPNTQYFSIQQFSYDEITEIYNKEKDSGWQISGTTIQLELDKNVKFVTINLKYDSAGTSYPTVPTDVKITFE